MRPDWMDLVLPGNATMLLERRRAEAIVRRIGRISLAFSVLTLAWIAVDAASFPTDVWTQLAVARVAAAFLLVALAQTCRGAASRRGGAWVRLGALFLVPALFFVASLAVLGTAPPESLDPALMAGYAFVPFLLAAGIAVFPLTAAESAALALVPVLAQAWALAYAPEPMHAWDTLRGAWLLLLLAGVGAFAAMSQRTLIAALVAQAMRDPLTGCHRRESGQELLELQFRLAVRRGESFTVLFADLDRFKRVNDAFGHEAGDLVLSGAARAIRSVLRESDTLLRWGGEEFVVLLPGTASAEAVRLIERLRARGVGRAPDGAPVTLSIGVASWPEDGVDSPGALIELADQRMYRAKQAGRNRYVRNAAGDAVPILA